MKKFLALIKILFALSLNAQTPQDYKINGNEYSKTIVKNVDEQTPFTFEDKNGKIYPIYISKNGRCYILRISSKTGNEYKYYLGEEISRDICAKLGVEYKEK